MQRALIVVLFAASAHAQSDTLFRHSEESRLCGNETIFEAYYTARLTRGLFGSLDLQHITNPGYNRDRGPVLVPGARLHVDF